MSSTAADPKPGYKTTEFWLTLLAILLTAWYSSGIDAPDLADKLINVVATVLAALGYTVVRGATKQAALKKAA